jgi:hypothetical protein
MLLKSAISRILKAPLSFYGIPRFRAKAAYNPDPTVSRRIQTLKFLAYIDLAAPWQPNAGGMRRWRDALRNWLIVGFRYAAQAAAMREGHLWDITPRVASGEHGGELPLPASMSPLTKRASVPERAT